MILAGFLSPTSGKLMEQGVDIIRRSAEKRNYGMVFQGYALFPHMTDYSDWRVWLTTAGASGVNAVSGILFSDAHCAQSACIAGQGIAIGDNLISGDALSKGCLLYTSPSPRDRQKSRMPSSA